jgi:hypothetical protein
LMALHEAGKTFAFLDFLAENSHLLLQLV